jgi:VIT1/CCC1 family predicted Fe2+/Mn2+ transporter
LRAGAIVTVVGLVFTVIAMVPLLVPSVTLPSALWFLAMLTGVGLAMVIAGLMTSAITRRRRVARNSRVPGS